MRMSLHNLEFVDWDGLLDYVGRPAILKAVFRWRMEARVQGPYQGRALGRLTIRLRRIA